MSIRLQGHQFNTMAWDGLTMAAPTSDEHLMLSSGIGSKSW